MGSKSRLNSSRNNAAQNKNFKKHQAAKSLNPNVGIQPTYTEPKDSKTPFKFIGPKKGKL